MIKGTLHCINELTFERIAFLSWGGGISNNIFIDFPFNSRKVHCVIPVVELVIHANVNNNRKLQLSLPGTPRSNYGRS